MACAQVARGKRDAGVGSPLPFNDAINNDPCGKPEVLSVGGVDTSAENLCMFHWIAKHGYLDYKFPITKE